MANLGDIILGKGKSICMADGSIVLYKKYDEEEEGGQEGGGGGSHGGEDQPVPENERRTITVEAVYQAVLADGEVISEKQELKVITYSKNPRNLTPFKAIDYYADYSSDYVSNWEVVRNDGSCPYEVKIAGTEFYYDINTSDSDKSEAEKTREREQRSLTENSTLDINDVFTEEELRGKDANYIYWDDNKRNLCQTVVIKIFNPYALNPQGMDGFAFLMYPGFLQKKCIVDTSGEERAMYFGIRGVDAALAEKNEAYEETLYIFKITLYDLSE